MRRYHVVSGCRAMIVGAALCVALGLASCAKIEARDLIREGNKLYNDGKYIEAIEKYDAAEQLEPDGVTLFWNRACAAEAQVLKMKDPSEAEDRRTYADMALRDFAKWYDRLEVKTPEDAENVQNHRLAILDADARCDELIAYWLDKHRENPQEEALYGTIARQYEKCDKPSKVDEWYVKRTEDFPDSVRSWHALAVRRFEPLYPDPETQLPYNENLPPAERIRIADEVIRLLDKATQIDPQFRDAYVYRAMAFTQRQYARVVVDPAETPEEKLEAILAREDSMLAWKQQKAVCDLDQLPECPGPTPDTPCCPPPPLTTEEQAQDMEARRQIEEEMKAAAGAADGKGKRKKRRGR